jgi:hypothetical protein
MGMPDLPEEAVIAMVEAGIDLPEEQMWVAGRAAAPAIRKQERERVFNKLHSRDVVMTLCQTREAEAGMPEAVRAVLEVAEDELEGSDA